MSKMLFFLFIMAVSTVVFAAEGWEVIEEVSVNGSIIIKRSYFDENVIKVVNESPTGSTETIVDLANDKVILINHFQKTYQVSKLSDYIAFAEGMANGLKSGGYVDPEKLNPKIAFVKKGSEKIGAWETTRYLVTVDGKDYQEVWIAPSFKTSPVIQYRKKYASFLPETLVKYRAIEEKIKDKAAEEGLIVKSIKIPLNKKLPKVQQTMKEIKSITITPALLAIPSGYTDKTVGVSPATTKDSK